MKNNVKLGFEARMALYGLSAVSGVGFMLWGFSPSEKSYPLHMVCCIIGGLALLVYPANAMYGLYVDGLKSLEKKRHDAVREEQEAAFKAEYEAEQERLRPARERAEQQRRETAKRSRQQEALAAAEQQEQENALARIAREKVEADEHREALKDRNLALQVRRQEIQLIGHTLRLREREIMVEIKELQFQKILDAPEDPRLLKLLEEQTDIARRQALYEKEQTEIDELRRHAGWEP